MAGELSCTATTGMTCTRRSGPQYRLHCTTPTLHCCRDRLTATLSAGHITHRIHGSWTNVTSVECSCGKKLWDGETGRPSSWTRRLWRRSWGPQMQCSIATQTTPRSFCGGFSTKVKLIVTRAARRTLRWPRRSRAATRRGLLRGPIIAGRRHCAWTTPTWCRSTITPVGITGLPPGSPMFGATERPGWRSTIQTSHSSSRRRGPAALWAIITDPPLTPLNRRDGRSSTRLWSIVPTPWLR
mmetsp:Transcript_31192/g.81799  ORF Transcript_31192/g.81799 Transcript_31192/m.81799 type:complete len:241 (+) Transcript_31192:1107-1829(+)